MNDIYVGALFSVSYLEHHGILGMKWGVRRFQREDGSLTSAGRKRKLVNEHKNEAEKKRGSLKGAGHRALGKVYELNEKAYNKLGNKTLASMNKAAKNQQLKKAEKADADAEASRKNREKSNNFKVKAKTTKSSSEKAREYAVRGAKVAAAALAAYGVYKAAKAYKKWSSTDPETRRQEISERIMRKERRKQENAHYSQLAKEMAAKDLEKKRQLRAMSEAAKAYKKQHRNDPEVRRQEISERIMRKEHKKQWDAHYSQLAKEMAARDREKKRKRR